MKNIRTMVYLICAVLAAAFLTACSGLQTNDRDSGSSNQSGGHGGHH